MFWRRKQKKRQEPCCSAVVVAAGSSTRMGMDKLMLPLDETPVIVYTLRAVQAAPSVGEIILVTREDLIVPMSQLCQDYAISKVAKVVRGGASRTQSVRLGTLEVSGDAQVIAIHDGARPFVSAEVIERAVAQAMETGAAAPAVPVKDTIKVAHDGVVESTPDRACLFAVQTPQVFEASLIKAALQRAVEEGVTLTDDCAAVERLGMTVALTRGDRANIKLTTPTDLDLGLGILNGRGEFV